MNVAPILRGRGAELELIEGALETAADGAGAVVLIESEAGLGKTRLLEQAERMACDRGFRVGTGTGTPAGIIELGSLLAAFGQVLGRDALAALPSAPEQRFWLFEELRAMLADAAREAPLLFLIDDLQWCDAAGAVAARTLIPRLRGSGIAWVLASRPDTDRAWSGAIDQLRRQGAAATRLAPLSEAAIGQVTRDTFGAEPSNDLLAMTERAQGSPYVLVELLSGLHEENLLRAEDGKVGPVDGRLPDRIGASMTARLAQLSPGARAAVTAAASLGRRISLSDLARMVAEPPGAVIASIAELTDAGFLTERPETFAFVHDLTREAVRASVPLSALRALDRQAVDILLAAGSAPSELALQLSASAEPGDAAAVAGLSAAVDQLAKVDPGTAADVGQAALRIALPTDAHRAHLVSRTALALHAAHRSEEAKAFADTALSEALGVEQEAEVRLGIAAMFSISPDERADAGRKALKLGGVSQKLRARHHAYLVNNLLVGGRREEARRALPRARAEVDRSDDPAAGFTLELTEGGLAYAEGDFEESLERIEAAIRRGPASGEDARERLARQWRSGALAVLDRLDEALADAQAGVEAATRDRQDWALHVFETWRGREFVQRGMFDEAAKLLDARFPPEDAHLVVGVGDAAGVVALGRLALHRGEARRGREAGAVATAMLEQTTPGVRRHGAWLLALQAMAAGKPDQALAWLGELGDAGRLQVLPRFAIDVTDGVHLARIAVAGGDDRLAAAARDLTAELAAKNFGVASLAGADAHVRGLIDDDAVALAEAVDHFAASPRPLAHGSALEDLAMAEATDDGRIEHLERALVVYSGIGASWDAARVRRRLRDLGVRRRGCAVAAEATGWEALTSAELAVALLLADGLTNREAAERLFLSPHTVNSHLRRVYAKLGVNSRGELGRLAAERAVGAADHTIG